MFMAADWSQLPKDLLQLISSKLDSEFDKLRFRSVCSTWRSSVPKNNHLLQNHLILFKCPIPSTNNNNSTTTYPLSKRSLFLIIPPPNQQTLKPWLIKIGPDSRDRTHLWDPLSRDKQFPLHFPHVIDVTQHHFLNLGDEFVIGDFPSQPSSSLIHIQKVVVADTWHNGGKVHLTINNSGKLAIFRCADEHWTIIHEDDHNLAIYDDVCVFNGQLIAVDQIGQTVRVGPDLRVDLVAKPVFRGGANKNFIVESDGELLLVVQFVSNGSYNRRYNMSVRFDVFRLDEKKKKWVEVINLGGRVLFLGEDSVFSASASDLCIHNGYSARPEISHIIPSTVFGNCVIFRDDIFRNVPSTELGTSVYHLDIDWTSPLSDFPCFSKLFWPPPEWVGLRIDNNRVCVLD